MVNSRAKGKRIENKACKDLRPIFPDVHRDWKTQTAVGGCDLAETEPFSIEVKGGKAYTWKGIRKVLDQATEQAQEHEHPLAIVYPHREDPYVMMPLDDWLELLEIMKENGII